MSLEQAILEAVRALAPDQQQQVLLHATRLLDEAAAKEAVQERQGILAGRGISKSSENIDQIRRQMW